MREKKVFQGGNLADVVLSANIYLAARKGWDVIQLTYDQHNSFYTIAFTAVDKSKSYTRRFFLTNSFEEITGVKEVGVFWVGPLMDPVRWFVGVPV